MRLRLLPWLPPRQSPHLSRSISVHRPSESLLGSYHWARTSNPFTLKLDNNVTSA
jgi:hypothetical protein